MHVSRSYLWKLWRCAITDAHTIRHLKPNALVCYLAMLCQLVTVGVAQTTSTILNVPVRQAAFADAFSRNRSFPTVSNGYLLSFSRQSTPTQPNIIHLTSLQNGKQQKIRFALQQAETFIEDGSVTTSGHVLIAGSYVRASDGAAVNFFANVDPSGKNSFLVDLGDYTPERICDAPDGTVWTLGQVWTKEGSTSGDYTMLRSYAEDGTPKGSYFQRSALPPGYAVNFHQRAVITPALLSCGDRSVGAYVSPGGKLAYWTEIQTNTGAAESWTVGVMPHSRMTGLSLLGTGTVYASFRHDDKRGLYLLALGQESSASWNPVPASEGPSSRVARLLGRDGPYLVYFTTDQAAENPILYWSQP